MTRCNLRQANFSRASLKNVEFGVPKPDLMGHKNPISTIAFTNDGKYLVSGSWDKTIKIWNFETSLEVRTLIGHTNFVFAIAVSRDGKFIISGSED